MKMYHNCMYDNKIGCGCECRVFNVGDNIVYKEFTGYITDSQTIETEFAFRMQYIAYKAGIAPEPIAKLDMGYFSRMVEPCEKYMRYHNWKTFRETKQWRKFIETVNKVFGGVVWDLHDGNVARFPDGTLCIIDFGYIGFNKTEVGKQIALEIGLFEED